MGIIYTKIVDRKLSWRFKISICNIKGSIVVHICSIRYVAMATIIPNGEIPWLHRPISSLDITVSGRRVPCKVPCVCPKTEWLTKVGGKCHHKPNTLQDTSLDQ